MQKRLFLITMAAGCLFMSSCVSKKALEGCQNENKELTGEIKELSRNYQEAKEQSAASRSRVASLEDQLEVQKKGAAALQQALDKSLTASNQTTVNISKLVDQINESNQYIRHLVEVKSKSDSLNMVLTNNLTRSHNTLYKSGSYEINDRAAETLSKIAKIIMDYKDYDVLVEGNTDDVPISRQNIRNNWDLSCLRASSVVQYLQTHYGVDPKRLTAGGRGEYNPLASNGTEVGRTRNRRTQIIITPKLDQFMDLIDKAPEAN